MGNPAIQRASSSCLTDNVHLFFGVEGRYNDRPHAFGNWTVTEPKQDDALSKALSNPGGMDRANDRYNGNFVFGVDWIYGRCLTSEPQSTISFRTKVGTDFDLELQGKIKSTQKIVKSGFAIASETTVRAQAGMNWQETLQRQNEDNCGYIKYEADVKSGPLFRWDHHLDKVPLMFELRPYAGIGYRGKTVYDATNPSQTKGEVQALVGVDGNIRFLERKYPGQYGPYLIFDINNTEASVGAGFGF